LILSDNGYLPASNPQENDLVIYRNEDGRCLHTGVVHSVAPTGQVLVESKWAWGSPLLHRPRAEPFGGECAYLRSARVGHLLRGLETTPPETALPSFSP